MVSPSQLQTVLHLCHVESLNIDVHLYLENLYESSRVTCPADSEGAAPWWWGETKTATWPSTDSQMKTCCTAPNSKNCDTFVGSISETTMTVRVREPKRPVSSFVRPLSLQPFHSSRLPRVVLGNSKGPCHCLALSDLGRTASWSRWIMSRQGAHP